MNESITPGNEMAGAGLAPRDIISRIMEHALKTRPKKDVYYLPYKKMAGIGFHAPLSYQEIDLFSYFPKAKDGDIAAVDFCITTACDYDIYLNVSGNVRVSFEQETIFTCLDGQAVPETAYSNQFYHIPLHVRAGRPNHVRVICVKHGDAFGFRFVISVKRYPSMWANDYLYAARATSPIPAYEGEDGFGITEMVSSAGTGMGVFDAQLPEAYLYPSLPGDSEIFDFGALCPEGSICYVYTEAAESQCMSCPETVDAVWVNGVRINAPSEETVSLSKGDAVLLRCRRNGTDWRLGLDTERLTLSFLNSNRGRGDKAVFLGPFYDNGVHGPEFPWDFSKVFINERGERLYWKFCDGSQLRICLDSVFYVQWFYALMVGFYGIRRAAQWLGDECNQRLFCDNMSFLAQYFDYIRYDTETNIMPAFMPRTAEMNVLDNIGTMGMNLIDGFLDSNDTRLLPLIDEIALHAENDIPRLEDGTYYRVDTMWVDDLYMSCPFLIRVGKLTGNAEWYQKAVDQILGFQKKLYIEEENLFSHIYFPKEGKANLVPWGRGNGWVMWTLSELLMLADGSTELSALRRLFQNMAGALLELQDESGLWRQVLNRNEPESYLETSCTAMFLLAFTRGVKYGWLPREKYLPAMEAAWQGILRHSVDLEGNVYGVCMGSGCAMEAEYYFTIPTIINDDHGTGIVLAAGSEFCAYLES